MFAVDGNAGSPVALTDVNGQIEASITIVRAGGGQSHDYRVVQRG